MDEKTMKSCDRMCRYCYNASGKCPSEMCFDGTDFLVPSFELKERLEMFACSIQRTVRTYEDEKNAEIFH